MLGLSLCRKKIESIPPGSIRRLWDLHLLLLSFKVDSHTTEHALCFFILKHPLMWSQETKWACDIGWWWCMGGWSQILFHRKINVIVLISWIIFLHLLFELYISVSCMFNTQYSSVLTIIYPDIVHSTILVKQTSTDTYRIPTGCLTHENWTNCILTRKKHSSTSNLYPVASIRSLEHVQNLQTEKTGQNWYYLTPNAFTAWRTDKKRMWKDTHGQRILLSITRPLALSGKVWQSLKTQKKKCSEEWLVACLESSS